ncbi:MAG: hypothetical protein AB7U36_01070, partial [Desulfobacter sp.]
CDIPKPFEGAAITLVIGGIIAIAFMGFTGVDSGVKKALKPVPHVSQVQEQPQSVALLNTKDCSIQGVIMP